MDIGVPYRILGRVDVAAAVALVRDLPDSVWEGNRFRQEVLSAGPHRSCTRAILLKYNWVPWQFPWRVKTMAELVADWCRQEGLDPEPVMPHIESENRHGAVNVFPQWGDFRDVIAPVVTAAVAPLGHKNGVVNRIALVEMAPGGRIDPHVDGQDMAALAHRIHVPLITPPGVVYKIDGRKLKMQVGRAYDFNNRKTHSVRNGSKRPRVNILIDYLPDPGVKIDRALPPSFT